MTCTDCPDPTDPDGIDKLRAEGEVFETPRERAMAADAPPTLPETVTRLNALLRQMAESHRVTLDQLMKDTKFSIDALTDAQGVFPELADLGRETLSELLRNYSRLVDAHAALDHMVIPNAE